VKVDAEPLTRPDTTDGSLSSDDSLRTGRTWCVVHRTFAFALEASRGISKHHWLSSGRGALVALGARQWCQRVSVVSASATQLSHK